MYGTLEMYTYTAEKAKIDTTNSTLDAIERALKLYYATNGDLPCPADGSLAVTNTNFGLGTETDDNLTSHRCLYDNLYGVANSLSSVDGNGFSGVVPTRTLNLPDSYMFDGWGNRITYVVDTPCVNSFYTRVAECLLVTAANPGPTIKVFDNSDSNTGTAAPEDPADKRTGSAAYVVISHGKNGIGAWHRNGGTARIPSTATTSVAEMENAHVSTAGALATGGDTPNDSFRDDVIKDWTGVGASYFDDLVRWKTAAQIAYTN